MKQKLMRTRVLAAGSALALALGLMTAAVPASAADQPDICYPGMTLRQCSGDLGNGLGKYEVLMPENFNGTLLLFFHGIRFGKNTPVLQSLKAAGIDYSKDPSYSSVTVPGLGPAWVANGRAELAPGGNEELARAMMAKGYGVAGLGYGTTQSWAVQEALGAGQAFVKLARSGYVYGLKRIIVWSESMGTLPALKLAETTPGVNGMYSTCPTPAATEMAFSQALDALYVLKVLGGLDLKLTYSAGPAGLAEAYGDLNKVLGFLGSIRADANAVAPTRLLSRNVVLLAGLLAGLPEASATYDGITTGGPILASQINSSAAMAENIGAAALLATVLRFDVESRIRVAGGIATGSANFTDNVNTSYTDLLSDEQRSQYETFLNLGGTSVLDTMLGALDASKGNATLRYAANPAAVAAAKSTFPEYTSTPKVPTVLLGYEVDNVTQAGQVARYVESAKSKTKKGKPNLAVAMYAAAPADGWSVLGDAAATAAKRTSGIGHCGGSSSLTGAQHLALVPALDTWIRKGPKAGAAAINAVRNNPALGFNTDPDWEPVLPKR